MEQGLLNDLSQFIGTEQYYYSAFKLLKLTDGINYLRNKANCYWLMDIIESVQHLPQIKANIEFLVWRIRVNSDSSWVVDVRTDSDKPILFEQKGEYTDFPLKEFEFYQIDDVLLLKSEY